MSDEIPLELIRPEPLSEIPESATELAKKELQAFESPMVKHGASEEYNAADTQHKIALLTLKVSEENLKLDQKRIDIDREKAHIESLRQDIKARKDYSDKIFKLVSFWLVGIFAAVIFNSIFGKLSDAVVMALIGGTTINVLGLFLVVANYLFPKNGKSPTPSSGDPGKI